MIEQQEFVQPLKPVNKNAFFIRKEEIFYNKNFFIKKNTISLNQSGYNKPNSVTQ
jgi:hypothetical protein